MNCGLVVIVRFKATGNAPILKQSVFKVTATHKFSAVIEFLRKQLDLKPSESLVSLFYLLITDDVCCQEV